MVAKTFSSTKMYQDKIAEKYPGRKIFETPIGFKYICESDAGWRDILAWAEEESGGIGTKL